jgi:putative salt-induced outer membrane protein YdiY
MPSRRFWLFLSTFFGLPLAAAAQTPAAAAPPPPPPLYEGSAEFAFVGTSGNSSTQTIGAGGEFIYRPEPWEGKVKLNYVRNKADEELTAQSFLFATRAQRSFRARASGFGQYEYQRDRFAGILNRNAFEGGVEYTVADTHREKLTTDGGFGYAHESRLLAEDLSAATLGAGAAYALKISETSRFTEDGHLVFSLAHGSDWRYTNTAALSAKVSSLWSLKLSNTIQYVNFPAPGFKNTDVQTAIALDARF